MSSRSTAIRAAGERLSSLLSTMALPRLYVTGFFAAPLLQTIYNSSFVAFFTVVLAFFFHSIASCSVCFPCL